MTAPTASRTPLRNRIGRLTTRAGWGVADQALSSLTNFAVGIYVARSLGTSGLGAFSLAFATYLIALNASRGLATDPLVVRYSGTEPALWRRAVASSTGVATAVGAGAASVAAGMLLSGSTGAAFVALGVMLPGLAPAGQLALRVLLGGQGRAGVRQRLRLGTGPVPAPRGRRRRGAFSGCSGSCGAQRADRGQPGDRAQPVQAQLGGGAEAQVLAEVAGTELAPSCCSGR